jgi:hypothetical protein
MPCSVHVEFSGTDLWLDPQLCPTCGSKVGKYEASLYKVMGPWRKGFALSLTSDGFYLVSKKLLPALSDSRGVSFLPLERGYAAIKFHRRVELDIPEDMTSAKDLCRTCGQYQSLSIHLYYRRKLAAHEAPIGEMEIVCSRLEWGDRLLRKPDLIVGDGVRKILIENRIKGMYLRELDYPGNGVVSEPSGA